MLYRKILEKQIALVISENKSCADKIKSTFCEDNENTKLFEDAPGNSNFMKLASLTFFWCIFSLIFGHFLRFKKQLIQKILQSFSYKKKPSKNKSGSR